MFREIHAIHIHKKLAIIYMRTILLTPSQAGAMIEKSFYYENQDQRHFSWDDVKFDFANSASEATYGDNSSDDNSNHTSYSESFEARISQSSTLAILSDEAYSFSEDERDELPPRKKHRGGYSTMNKLPFSSFIPFIEPLRTGHHKTDDVELDRLPTEIQRGLLSYLDSSSLRSFVTTSRNNLTLGSSNNYWIDHCLSKWPLVQELSGNTSNVCFACGHGTEENIVTSETLTMTRDCYYPLCVKNNKDVASRFEHSPKYYLFRDHASCSSQDRAVDFSILHGLSCDLPRGIDKIYFTATSNNPPVFCTYEMVVTGKSSPPARSKVIQLIRPWCGLDRSVCSDLAFPSLTHQNRCNWSDTNTFEYLRRVGCTQLIKECYFTKDPLMKPFSSPYLHKSTVNAFDSSLTNVEIDVAPRLCAYFEVAILERDPTKELNHLQFFTPGEFSGCIAVGLSTKKNDHVRTPVGFLGDDGGIYYAQDDYVSPFSTPFGIGDTIGCGIDYLNQTVFFTLNGSFLGHAFSNIDLTEKLFPTVGVDSMNPFACNFGSKPFVFDLYSFCRNQKSLKVPFQSSIDCQGSTNPFLPYRNIEHTVHQPKCY